MIHIVSRNDKICHNESWLKDIIFEAADKIVNTNFRTFLFSCVVIYKHIHTHIYIYTYDKRY